MKKKICSKCGEEKELSGFTKDNRRKDGVTGVCLVCGNKNRKNYYKKNKELIGKKRSEKYFESPDKEKERLKIYYQQNKHKVKERVKKYSENNKSKISQYERKYYEKNKETLYNYKKEYRKKYRLELNKKELERKKNPLSKLKHIVRNRIYVYFKNKGYKKKCKTFQMIGCSSEELKNYIEKLFTDGMCWEKIGKEIHIDHIIPLSSAKTEEEIYKLCHYTNLQPLWAKDNLEKRDKIL